jgi:predicted dehydrogenase
MNGESSTDYSRSWEFANQGFEFSFHALIDREWCLSPLERTPLIGAEGNLTQNTSHSRYNDQQDSARTLIDILSPARFPMFALNRRDFLNVSSSALALSTVANYGIANQDRERILRLAFIGVGGRGGGNLATMAKDTHVEVAALCDIDGRTLTKAHEAYPKAKVFKDFRVLYQDARDIDAVVVSTAEHTHAYATLPALQLGKHVYCEKPLTHNVTEARLITEFAAKTKVATQMGTQIHAGENYHRVVELIQTNAIGPVHEVHVWVARAWGLQSEAEAKVNDITYVTDRPKTGMEPPADFDWDLWLGPAAYRPYSDVYFPGPKWYRWWEFGNGTMSDLGSHWIDLPFWALKLDAPVSIEAFGDGPAHPEIAPASMTAVYEYKERGDMPPCRLTWYQGKHQPALLRDGKIPNFQSGVLFVGEKGMLLADYGRRVLLPEDRFQGFVPPKPFVPDSPGHHEEWLLACRTGSPTASPFSYAGPLTEANHLGNVAYRAGGKILWDSKAMRITNNEAANAFLTRKPREGWSLQV